ncbi:Rieske (2Fe-2S) protein [Corynebacterium breve]|uniref:Rieske (2Fe-2S) protein n=1 Tax=Corynebacterium breve TaxID=3049799 RepID=A0ABY8VDB8_9CORY|nr:Rieske (2Fe-2S) protein [Corynebacterium breve]WIM67659.1 Rieske (2Fe-2S) protein [Corynebacterium breve]
MIFAAKVNDIESGRAVKVAGTAGDIAVFRDTTGDFFAVDDKCAHLGASLSQGTCADGVVECWLHHGLYSLSTGERVKYPASGFLHTYDIEVRDDEIWVNPEPNQPA